MGNTPTKPGPREMNDVGARSVQTSTSRRVESSSNSVNERNYSEPPPSYEVLERTHRHVERLYPSAPLEYGVLRSENLTNSNNGAFTRKKPIEDSNKFPLGSDNEKSSIKYQTPTKPVLKKELDISYLLELSLQSSPVVVKELKENIFSFKDLFQKPITQSLLLVLMKLVKKICMTDQIDDKIQILKIICCENFFDILGGYISDLPTHTQDVVQEDRLFLMEGVLPFFECIALLIPHQVSLKLRELIIKTKLSIHGIEQYQKLEINDYSKSRLEKLDSLIGTSSARTHRSPNSIHNLSLDFGVREKLSDKKNYTPKSFVEGSKFMPKEERLEHTSDSMFNPEHYKALCRNNVPGVQKNIFFIERVNDKQESVNNAEFFMAFALYLTKQKYSANDIIMLTTSETDLNILVALKVRSRILEKMTVQMITNQGNISAPIVLLFFSLTEEGTQSVCSKNLLHKMFLGAKEGIYMIGSMEYLAKVDSFWCIVKNTLQNYAAISPNLTLCCQTHKRLSYVNAAKDFKDLRNGGCILICNMVLPCGHQCVRRCHSEDLKHKEYHCHKPCMRNPEKCTRNHPCPKLCHEKCGLCQASVVMSGVKRICCEVSQPNQNIKQNSISQESVQHKGIGRPNDRRRGTSPHPVNKDKSWHNKKKSTALPCGHFSSQKLHLPNKPHQGSLECVNLCQAPCVETLECGHKCRGTCGKCRQGKVHVTCCETKKLRLACGHRHVVSCSDGVSNCEQKCFNECSHSICREKCGIPCTPCNKKCASKCIHSRCTKKCYEPCNRLPCREPCQELLDCGHQCVSFCGERCPPGPENCRICNPEKFKRADSSGYARFVLLEDCNHLVRANELDRKIFLNSFILEGLECPICHYNIVKTGRYLNYNKELHFNLHMVRSHYNEYCNELKNTFRNIITEIKENNLPLEVEYNPVIHKVKDLLKRAVDLQDIDKKSIILLHFVRIIMCSLGAPPYSSMQWMLNLLLERYDSGFSSQVLKELYIILEEYQRINGQIHKKKMADLREAISFFHLLERSTWFKCPKGHITPYNSSLSCELCDVTF